MTKQLAELIEVTAVRNCLEVELHEEYSGRGMFGETTTGVTGSLSEIMLAMLHLDKEELEENLPSDFSIDNIGYDKIVY